MVGRRAASRGCSGRPALELSFSNCDAKSQIDDSIAFRKLMKIDFMAECVPDSATRSTSGTYGEDKLGERIFLTAREA